MKESDGEKESEVEEVVERLEREMGLYEKKRKDGKEGEGWSSRRNRRWEGVCTRRGTGYAREV